MSQLLGARALQSFVVLVLVYTATFWMLMAVPGEPFLGEKKPPQAVHDELERRFHLNGPKYVTFFYYTANLLRGDLGRSIIHEDQTVASMILVSLPCSVTIGGLALLLALWMGIALGTLGALYRRRWQDSVIALFTLVGISVPFFVIAIVILFVFSRVLRVFPNLGWGSLSQLVMPVATLAIYYLAAITRLTRVSVLEQLSLDYVRTAHAKGVPAFRLLRHHVLRNASLPVLSYLGPAAASAITGSFVVEKVFAIPGMGKAFVDACIGGDLPVVLGCVLVFTVIVLLFNFMIDITYALADPRISSW